MKTGLIILWSGAIVDIPSGFVLCDGNNNTPDLRNNFVIGAGGSHAVDDTGGSINHTHGFTSDGHAHSIGAGADLQSGFNFAAGTDSSVDTGTTDPSNGLPPLYALAYIMKT